MGERGGEPTGCARYSPAPMRRLALAPVLIAAFALGACGSERGGSTQADIPSGGEAPTTTTAAPAPSDSSQGCKQIAAAPKAKPDGGQKKASEAFHGLK